MFVFLGDKTISLFKLNANFIHICKCPFLSSVHLDVKLEVALVHLSRDHALYDFHRHELIAVKGWAEDVVGLTLLDLQIQKPVEVYKHQRKKTKIPQANSEDKPKYIIPFPACSAELMATGHVNRFLKDRDGRHADTTLSDKGRGNVSLQDAVCQFYINKSYHARHFTYILLSKYCLKFNKLNNRLIGPSFQNKAN